MPKIKVQLNIYGKSNEEYYLDHLSQIVTGFVMLEKSKRIDFRINFFAEKKTCPYPYKRIIEAEINGLKVLFDMEDYSNWICKLQFWNSQLDQFDFVFKRSYSETDNKILSENFQSKIYPLGFNYHVTVRNNFNYKNKGMIQLVKQIFKDVRKINYPSYFESRVNYKKSKEDLSILFFTRLWDDGWMSEEEKQYINETRISIVRNLRKEFPQNCNINNSVGGAGINKSPISETICKDIILPSKYTDRISYIKRMKNSDICIGTTGLSKSIGWKTGEYVAASRCIINEKFNYQVPGNFLEGKNYFSFDTVDECLQIINKLFENPELVYEAKKQNELYYHKYLRPDRLIQNVINIVIGESK